MSLFEKYKGKDKLFSFCETYSTPDILARHINNGLKDICYTLNIEKVTTYTFRHSWATIARNDCNFSDSDVAFALNHASEHKITRGYIKTDYTLIDRMNESVIDYVFFGNHKK